MKPRALDLFCGAGGVTKGLQLAGFHVTGVDIKPQPNYCGDDFLEADALEIEPGIIRGRLSLIWASPPCQRFTAYRRRAGHVQPAGNLIPETRAMLARIGVPSVIENVQGAPLENPALLCGSMFGLEVRRHRLFEASFPLEVPACNHASQQGDFPPATNRTNRRKTAEIGVYRIPLETQKRAMGVDWHCTLHELSQMVPPAYSEYIGRAFLAQRERSAA